MKPHHLPEKCPTCSAPIRELTGEGLQEVAQYECFTFPTDLCGTGFIGSRMQVNADTGKPYFTRFCPYSEEYKAAHAIRQARYRQIEEAVAAALIGVGATHAECLEFSSRMARYKYKQPAGGIWQLLPSKEKA